LQRNIPLRHPILTTLAALLLALGLSGTANAGPYEDALAAYGRGDYATSLRFMRALGDQGDARAQGTLGVMYKFGRGVPQNHAEAAKWYRLAADQGIPSAQWNLGVMYDKGEGVPQNYAEAVKWYRLAADQGLDVAQNNLGVMFERGQGVSQDHVLAHKWFNLAGAGGDEDGRKNRDRVATKMTPAQIAEAQRLAHEWKPKL